MGPPESTAAGRNDGTRAAPVQAEEQRDRERSEPGAAGIHSRPRRPPALARRGPRAEGAAGIYSRPRRPSALARRGPRAQRADGAAGIHSAATPIASAASGGEID